MDHEMRQEEYNRSNHALRIAARGSLLSRAQVALVREQLAGAGITSEFVPVKTKGDKDRNRALREIGGDGLFVREIERELLEGRADVAVHCGKDLPYRIADGLVIAGIPKAAAACDCLIWRDGAQMDALRVIGTGSARRIRELQKFFPDADFREIRGNINTRLEKLREGQYDGIVLAKAGLERLKPDLAGLCVREFLPEEMIPAACQGILALECRADDLETIRILKNLTDPDSAQRFYAERALFCNMEADCATALGVYAEIGEVSGAQCEGNCGACARPQRDGCSMEQWDGQIPEQAIRLHAMFDGKRCTASGTVGRLDDLCETILQAIYKNGCTE